jgi:hypothetical protein
MCLPLSISGIVRRQPEGSGAVLVFVIAVAVCMRAEVVVADIDLLQLSAAVRVIEIETKIESPEKVAEDGLIPSEGAEEDGSANEVK